MEEWDDWQPVMLDSIVPIPRKVRGKELPLRLPEGVQVPKIPRMEALEGLFHRLTIAVPTAEP